jgi:hypothetical protein
MTLRFISAMGIATAAAMLIGSAPAMAQSSDSVDLSSEASGTSGRIAVNAAAGTFNQQANAAVIGSAETVLTKNVVIQVMGVNNVCTLIEGQCGTPEHVDQKALISGDAFSHANGTIAVNAAAGVENQQANLAMFGITNGIDGRAASLQLLGQVRASKEPAVNLGASTAEQTADIGPGAFSFAIGLVQVNATAGERNSSANLFGLTITGGTD